VSQAIKYIFINLHIGYGTETIKFIIKTKFFGVQIDNNVMIICQVYVSIDVLQCALPWWQLQILHIFTSLCLFELAFGAVGQFLGQQDRQQTNSELCGVNET